MSKGPTLAQWTLHNEIPALLSAPPGSMHAGGDWWKQANRGTSVCSCSLPLSIDRHQWVCLHHLCEWPQSFINSPLHVFSMWSPTHVSHDIVRGSCRQHWWISLCPHLISIDVGNQSLASLAVGYFLPSEATLLTLLLPQLGFELFYLNGSNKWPLSQCRSIVDIC